MADRSSLDESLAALLEELGPFDPAGYAFEPELRAEVPRPIPYELREGRHGQKQRRLLVELASGAFGCFVASLLPIVQHWGLFFLPLAYLHWVGLALALLVPAVWVRQRLTKGPSQYVVAGTPLVARVCARVLRVTKVMDDDPLLYRYFVTIQYRHPTSGELVLREVPSNDITRVERDQVTTTYNIGDYVTAVYFDTDPDESLRLYGFLELRHDLGVVRRETDEVPNDLRSAAEVLLLFGVLFLCGYAFYAYARYAPLEWNWTQLAFPVAIGMIVVGGGTILVILMGRQRTRAQTVRRNALALEKGEPPEQLVPLRGGLTGHGRWGSLWFLATWLIAGSLAGLSFAFAGNALLDRSPAEERPVTIHEMVQTTYRRFLFRSHSIEYTFEGDKHVRSYLSSPSEMEQFGVQAGTARVRSGAFGWPWVEAIEPRPEL
jgi:hypothetical protein